MSINKKFVDIVFDNNLDRIVCFNEQDENGNTLLHIACEYGNFEMVRLLIEIHNAKKNIKNNNGQTPLDIAFIYDEKEHQELKSLFD